MATQAALRRPTFALGMRRGGQVRSVLTHTILILWSLVVAFPLYWVIITSIKMPIDVYGQMQKLIPWVQFKPVGIHWEFLFTEFAWASIPGFMNSLVIGLSTAVATVILGGLAGYGLTRFQYRIGRLKNDDIAFYFISQRMLPPVVLVFPYLIMFKMTHLLDTQLGMILAYTTFSAPLAIWIMRDFFAGIPRELDESALIDGCSRLGAFRRVSLPLAAPGLVATFILTLIAAWNEYLFAFILTFQKAQTLPIVIAGQNATQRGIEYWTMAALIIWSITPIIILGLLLEKYITRGLTAGALK